MSDIVVSVIVLTYNHKPYICQALDSILSQIVNFPYEILIGDDASTDGTSEIVRDYAKRYPDKVRAFVREQNMGATKNLYDLFSRAKGTYIASCEGDDFWTDSGKLQLQVDYLRTHPQLSGCTHPCGIVDEKGKRLPEEQLPWVCKKSEYRLKDFRGIYLPGQPATLVHKNFFLDHSHDYSIIYRANNMVADRTIVMILALQGPIHRLSQEMSCYRKRSADSQSASATNIMFASNPDVNRMQLKMTCALEHYAAEEFGVRLHFLGFKLEQRIKAAVKCVLGKPHKNEEEHE